MRILWLNWRDIKNPQAGGAEVMTHETAKRLVKKGHHITIFTAKFPGAKSQETIDGIKILRRGNRLTCRYWAFRTYKKEFKDNIDLVVDEINTIPFFTNFYVHTKKVVLIHQLAKEYWWSEIFFPLNLFGYLLESFYLKLYKNLPTIAASESTKRDLEKLGFNNVFVFHQGLSVKPSQKIDIKKQDILFLGRLTKPKGPQDAIYAFAQIVKRFPAHKLIIVGKGKPQFTKSLKNLTRKLNIEKKVKFEGFVSQQRKTQLLKKAAIILIPSAREGWNLVPIEANSFSCVPIGYDVPGLKDSIINGKTGILTKNNSPTDLALSSISLLQNKQRYTSIQKNGLLWSKKFSWDQTHTSIFNFLSSLSYKILWLSWRDIKNPQAGGAERVAIETAKRFVKNNKKVTIFTSSFDHAKSVEYVDGIEIRRKGNLLTCRIHAFFYYLKTRSATDLVIDEINTIPFFSVLYAHKKTVVLIHQLAREYWGNLVNWPLSLLGEKSEPLALSLYKNRPTMVVSNSTKDDLKKLNFKNIRVIREGLDLKPKQNKKKANTVLYLGRLTPAKGPQDALLAFKKIVEAIPNTKLIIAGSGTQKFTTQIKNLAKSLHISKSILFAGYVSEKEKISLLAKSKIVLIPSVREGWNLVAIEAMSQGAVPIAYNVPGLKDSILNGKTGILVEKDPLALAEASISLLNNNKRRITFSQNGFAYSQKFSWDNTYGDFKKFVL